MIEKLIWLIIIFSPLARAGWDLWALTIIHLMCLIILGVLLIKLNYGRYEFKKTPLDLSILFFIIFVLVSFSQAANQYNARNEFFNIINYIFLYYLVVNYIKTQKQKEKLFYLFSFTGMLVSVMGIYQGFEGIKNVYASMVNPNILAGYLIILFPLVVSFMLDKITAADWRNHRSGSLWLIVSLAVMFTCLLLTGSLGGLLSLYTGLLIGFLWYWKSKKQIGTVSGRLNIKIPLIIFSLCVVLFFVLIFYKLRDPELANRLFWWQGALRMMAAKPLTGVGIGCFGDVYLKYKVGGLNSLYTHNYLLQIGAEIGLLGLGSFIWLLVIFFRQFSTRLKSKHLQLSPYNLTPFLSGGLLGSISAILIFSLIDYNLSIPANALVFWIVLGMSVTGENESIKVTSNSLKWIINIILILLLIFGTVVIIKPFLASQRLVWGSNALVENRLDEAEQWLRKSIKLDDLNPLTFQQLSAVYNKKGETELAIEVLNKAVNLTPGYAPFHYDLGLLYKQKGQDDLALEEFKKAISNHYQKIIYHLALMEIYEKKGLKELADNEYKIVTRLKEENR